MTHYKIYAILRSSDRLILYVGRTCDKLKSRLNSHVSTAKTNARAVSKWPQWIRENPLEKLAIVELARGDGNAIAASIHERKIIEELANSGVELMNTDGTGAPTARTRANKYARPRSSKPSRNTGNSAVFGAKNLSRPTASKTDDFGLLMLMR